MRRAKDSIELFEPGQLRRPDLANFRGLRGALTERRSVAISQAARDLDLHEHQLRIWARDMNG
jgi:transposase-like protein